jgi:hypothetical protein
MGIKMTRRPRNTPILKAALIADRAGRHDAPRRGAFKLTKEREIGSYQWYIQTTTGECGGSPQRVCHSAIGTLQAFNCHF